MFKRYFLITLLLFVHIQSIGQSISSYQKNYTLIKSGDFVLDKNFYLFTVIKASKPALDIISTSPQLNSIFLEKCQLIHDFANHGNMDSISNLLEKFKWNYNDSVVINYEVKKLYNTNQALFDKVINTHLRPSGYYQRFTKLKNCDFFLMSWLECLHGLNNIIDQYGLGKNRPYSYIDSVSYDVNGFYFKSMFSPLFNYLDERKIKMRMFYEPSLEIALKLMDYSDRNEPAAFEPLEKGLNKPAFKKTSKIFWSKYKYSSILVPGEGPELSYQCLSPGGKLRCELAADRYKKGLAPFLILSGGYCHPFHTHFCEAIEMRIELIKKFKIPEDAIIIEPQARHTTTNFRNANRLIIRYGLPIDKPALCVTAINQANYIENNIFDERNIMELGYLPYRDKKRISIHEIEFYPVLDCLHMDPEDPLDP